MLLFNKNIINDDGNMIDKIKKYVNYRGIKEKK